MRLVCLVLVASSAFRFFNESHVLTQCQGIAVAASSTPFDKVALLSKHELAQVAAAAAVGAVGGSGLRVLPVAGRCLTML